MSPCPLAWKSGGAGPHQEPCYTRCSKPLKVCTVLYLCIYLWTAPLPLVVSSWPATCVPALTRGLAPPPALNLLVARVTETRVYTLQFEPSQKEQLLVVPQ